MKKNICLMMIILVVTAGCKKSDTDKDGGSCNLFAYTPAANVSVANACGMAISPSGRVVVTQYNNGYGLLGTTKVWNSYSDMLAKSPPAQSWNNIAAEAVAFDKDENIYVVETEQTAAVKIYRKNTVNGTAVYSLYRTIQNGFNNPRGVVFDSHNRMFLADDGNDRLLRFDNPMANDNFKIVAGEFGGLKGLAIDGDVLFITSYDKSRLYKCIITNTGLGETDILNVEKPVDVATYGGQVAVSAPDKGSVIIYDTGNITAKSSDYKGCKAELTGVSPVYGLQFVNTPSGTSILSAQYGKQLITLFQNRKK